MNNKLLLTLPSISEFLASLFLSLRGVLLLMLLLFSHFLEENSVFGFPSTSESKEMHLVFESHG